MWDLEVEVRDTLDGDTAGEIVQMADVKHRGGVEGPTVGQIHTDLYRLFFEEAPDGILAADSRGRLMDVNRRAVELTGYAREELTGMAMEDLLDLADLARNGHGIDDLRSGASVLKETSLLRKE